MYSVSIFLCVPFEAQSSLLHVYLYRQDCLWTCLGGPAALQGPEVPGRKYPAMERLAEMYGLQPGDRGALPAFQVRNAGILGRHLVMRRI